MYQCLILWGNLFLSKGILCIIGQVQEKYWMSENVVYGHPGVQITADKEASGPPAGPPIKYFIYR